MSANTSNNLDADLDGARVDLPRPASEWVGARRPDMTGPGGPRTLRRTPRWLVVLLAVLGAVAVWAIGAAADVGDVVVDTGAALQPVTAASVMVASLLAGLAGWGVRALISRIDKNAVRARRIWLVLSGVVLLGSLLGVMGAITPGALLVLLGEHVVVGLILMIGLRR